MATLFPDPEETDRVLIALADQAQKHAREQLRAAQVVLDAGIWSIAFANAALALEEMGKSILCLSVLVWPDAKRQEAAEGFRRAVNDHESKSFCAHTVLGIVGEQPPADFDQLVKKARKDAQRINRRKFRSLYTDSNATGHVLSPQDITEEQAREMVRIVEKVAAVGEASAEALADPEAYLAVVRQLRAADADGSVWAASEDDVVGIITAARAVAVEEGDVVEALHTTPFGTLVAQMVGPHPGFPGGQAGRAAVEASPGEQPRPA